MIRIAWKFKDTGYRFHGTWHEESERSLLEEQVKYANERHPHIKHWIEESDERLSEPSDPIIADPGNLEK